jgi:hypothetical protein
MKRLRLRRSDRSAASSRRIGKKLENLEHPIAFCYCAYNIITIHEPLTLPPALEARGRERRVDQRAAGRVRGLRGDVTTDGRATAMCNRQERPYYHIAGDAITLLSEGRAMTWEEAWDSSALAVYPLPAEGRADTKKDAREKSCPRSAFLGLCERGWLTGVTGGAAPCSKSPNRRYAVDAVRYLVREGFGSEVPLTAKQLWNALKAAGVVLPTAHNHQMDVVLALWSFIDRERVRADEGLAKG